jgi:hypothetical protein
MSCDRRFDLAILQALEEWMSVGDTLAVGISLRRFQRNLRPAPPEGHLHQK